MSETRKYRKFTAQQKTEIVLASLRGPKTMAELCREHDIAATDTLAQDAMASMIGAGNPWLPRVSENALPGHASQS